MIHLHGLTIPCTIGVHPHEKTTLQNLEIDLSFTCAFPQTDNLQETIDYAAVAQLLTEVARQTHFHLLESYAQAALNALFETFPMTHATLTVKKQVPLMKWAGVTLEKSR